VNRGGSWNNEAANCRSANRNRNNPSNRNNNNGFRVALNSNGRKSWMASGGCPGIPDGTVRFPVWPGFGLVSKTSTRDRVVLVGRSKQLLGLVCPKALTFKDQDATIHGLVKQKNE